MLRKSNGWFQGYPAARKRPNSSTYAHIRNGTVLLDQLGITKCPIRDKLSCFNNYSANDILERTYKIAAQRCFVAVLKNSSKSTGTYLPRRKELHGWCFPMTFTKFELLQETIKWQIPISRSTLIPNRSSYLLIDVLQSRQSEQFWKFLKNTHVPAGIFLFKCQQWKHEKKVS